MCWVHETWILQSCNFVSCGTCTFQFTGWILELRLTTNSMKRNFMGYLQNILLQDVIPLLCEGQNFTTCPAAMSWVLLSLNVPKLVHLNLAHFVSSLQLQHLSSIPSSSALTKKRSYPMPESAGTAYEPGFGIVFDMSQAIICCTTHPAKGLLIRNIRRSGNPKGWLS